MSDKSVLCLLCGGYTRPDDRLGGPGAPYTYHPKCAAESTCDECGFTLDDPSEDGLCDECRDVAQCLADIERPNLLDGIPCGCGPT